jgi:hypothetical protein
MIETEYTTVGGDKQTNMVHTDGRNGKEICRFDVGQQ